MECPNPLSTAFKLTVVTMYTSYKMTPTTLDSCLLFRRGKNIIHSIIGVQVDNKMCATASLFSSEEDVASAEFQIR